MSNGIYVTPDKFVSFSELAKPPKDVVATRKAVGGGLTLGALPNPDPILKKMGKSIEVYRDLMADAHVGGGVRRRKSAVLALNYGFERNTASESTLKFLEDIFKKLKMRTIISQMLDAPLFGYTVLEVNWGEKDNQLIPIDIQAKPPEWFIFDAENNLRLKTNLNRNGIILPERKFLLLCQDATYTNPYGVGDLSRCFWPTQFKRAGFEFWLKFTEKYGSPFLVGKHPRNTHHGEVDELLTSLEQMIQDAVAAIPDDSSIEILEAAGKGASADIYERFLMFCRSEVSIALTGTNQTTEADTTNASAQAGLTVSDYIRDSDAEIVSESINQLVRWIVDVNFGEGEEAPLWEMRSPTSVDKVQAERDQLLKGAGANFTNEYFIRKYNLKEGDLSEQQQANDQSYDFSEANTFKRHKSKQQQLEKVTNQLTDATQPLIDSWISKIKTFAEESDSLEALQERLLAEFNNLPEDELAEAMGAAFEFINLSARAEVMK